MTPIAEIEEEDEELYPEETVLDEIDDLIELFTIGAKRRQADFRRWLARVVEEDEDDPVLAERAVAFYEKFSEIDQIRLVDLACGFWPAGPLVCGALLHEVIADPEKIELLFEHAGEDILRWFRRVPLDTLMSDEEMRALQALPSTIEAYHQTPSIAGPLDLGPYWTVADPRASSSGGATRVVKASVPRSAVLVYRAADGSPTMIVDFRRVAEVEVVSG